MTVEEIYRIYNNQQILFEGVQTQEHWDTHYDMAHIDADDHTDN